MARYECVCGAKYRFDDAHVGRKSKCRKCGSVFTLTRESDPIPIADEPRLSLHLAPPSLQAEKTGATDLPPPSAPSSQVIIEKDADEQPKGPRGYAQNVLWSFLFATDPRNLVIFLVLWAVLTIGDGFFGVAGVALSGSFLFAAFLVLMWVVFKGWFASVRFAIVESAAGGDSVLPNIGITTDWWEDYILPAIQWWASWLMILLPAILYTIHFASNHPVGPMASLGLDPAAAPGTDTVYDQAAFWVLSGIGLFLWPMVILCVALGGVTTILRFDLLLITIVKTLPVYLVTVVIVFAAEGGAYHLRGIIFNAIAPLSATGTLAPFGQRMIAAGAGDAVYLYFSIVMLRTIGLYYHHFKHRFAWGWG